MILKDVSEDINMDISTISRGPKGPPTTDDGGFEQYITQDPYGRQVTNLGRNIARGAATLIGGPLAGFTVNQMLSKEQEKQREHVEKQKLTTAST